jgi:hypothetical protein
MLLMFSAHPLITTLSVALGAFDCASAGTVTVAARAPETIHAVTLVLIFWIIWHLLA